VYSIVPDQLDDQREITCIAENPHIRGKAVEDTMQLSVMCKLTRWRNKTVLFLFYFLGQIY
jgi:hypothetical protein